MAIITIITIRNPTTDRIFINVTNHIVVVLLIIITSSCLGAAAQSTLEDRSLLPGRAGISGFGLEGFKESC